MKTLSRTLLIGLSILLPIVISLQLVIWLLRTVDKWSRNILELLLPEYLLFPGLPTVVMLLAAFFVGLTSRKTVLSEFWKLPGRLLEKLPVVQTIYGMIKDFFDLMSGKPFADQSVVWVSINDDDSRILGIVTKSGEDENSMLGGLISKEEIAVFLPMSYQAGGFTVVVPKSKVEPADLEPGEALQLIMSAGLGKGR